MHIGEVILCRQRLHGYVRCRRMSMSAAATVGVMSLAFPALAAPSSPPWPPIDSATFASFDWAAAKAHGTALPHPRSFPAGAETEAIFLAARAGERSGFPALKARALDNRGKSELPKLASVKSLWADDPGAAGRQSVELKQRVLIETQRTQETAFVGLVTGSVTDRADAMQRLLALSDLDPRGQTGVAGEDLSAYLVASTLALGVDWYYPYWSATERSRLVRAIEVRMEDFAQRLVRGPTPLARSPLNSHGNEVLGGLAEIAVLMLGETPLASGWFDEFVPLYARLLTPFGGEDGGYANGTAYASWDVGEYSLWHWDVLRRSIGLDLTRKPWAGNFGRFLVYFVPPGTPLNLFGDGPDAAMPESWSRYAKAYAARVSNPLNHWYAGQWFQENTATLELLMAPVSAPAASVLPEGTPNAAAFPSIGWVAMHSDLRDRGRTSLYFKSSPYGSVSHSHADQNSFVLNAGGQQLLVDSGYYDYFGSPHHYGWTKRTIAHNTVTFDGGKGQDDQARPWGDETAKGKILEFSTSPDIDLTVGDATLAYRGQLTKAARAIAYLRPNIFVVFDSLESAQPRKWEWNLHALSRFVQNDANTIVATGAKAKACVFFQSSTPTTFQQTNAFPAAPIRTKTNPRPDQWHGQYVANTAQAQFRSVAIITMTCLPVAHAIQFDSASTTVRIGGRELEFDGQRMAVKKK